MSIISNKSISTIGGFHSLQYCRVSNLNGFTIPIGIQIPENNIQVAGEGWQDIEVVSGSLNPIYKKKKSAAGTYYENSLGCNISNNDDDTVQELLNMDEPVVLKYTSNQGQTFIMGTEDHPMRQLFDKPAAPLVKSFAGHSIVFSGNTLFPPYILVK
jgi:hypothetical protein